VRTAPLRGIGDIANKFVAEVFLDEVALERGVDPLQFRLELLKITPRGQKVLQRVAELADWDRKRDNTAFGLRLRRLQRYADEQRRGGFSRPYDGTATTLDQSASSSSARISGSAVSDPFPISIAGAMIDISPLGAILTHGLNAVPETSGASVAARPNLSRPTATANVRPAIPIMKPRRENSVFGQPMWFMVQASREARSIARRMRG
jgi:hypothetical protein